MRTIESKHSISAVKTMRIRRHCFFPLGHAFWPHEYTAKRLECATLSVLCRDINPLRWSDPISIAKAERRGLWHDEQAEPPWQWRKELREHQRRGG